MDFIPPRCADQSLGPANQLLTGFISTLLAIHCNISTPEMWPEDYGPKALTYGLDIYDFVVIGAGSAGSVVASRLAENPRHKILLLEAGDDPPIESEIPAFMSAMFGSKEDWAYPTQSLGKSCLGRINEICIWRKGKVLGGSSTTNAMIYVRGNSLDYDEWKELGNPRWGWNDVLPYFQKSEDFNGNDKFGAHGVGGPLSVETFRSPKDFQEIIAEASKELGYPQVYDFVAGNDLGFGYNYGTVKDGRRMSTAKAFLRSPKPNLHIVKNAVATKIHFDGKKRATSVSFVYRDRHELRVKVRKEVVLSAGSIETPKLLMLSGIGPRNHLQSLGIPVLYDSKVGDNLQDHVRVLIFMKMRVKNALSSDIQNLDDVYNYWIHRRGPLAIAGYDFAGYINTKLNSRFPDVFVNFQPVLNATQVTSSYIEPIQRSVLEQIGPDDLIAGMSVTLSKPHSKGFVRLQSNDYRDKPVILHNYLKEPSDMQTFTRAILQLLEFEKTSVFRKVGGQFLRLNIPHCDGSDFTSERYWRCYVRYMTDTIYHPVGTAKMGPKYDPAAVVDSELRVWGVEGLRVIDASIMPTIVSCNTNAPTIMIGEKGADFVKSSWSKWK